MLVGGDFFRGRPGRKQRRARLGDVAEDGLLLLCVTLHGFDEIGNQVGSALQHDVHLRPSGFDRFILADQRVAHAHVLSEKEQRDQYQHHKYDQCFAHGFLLNTKSTAQLRASRVRRIQHPVHSCSYLLYAGKIARGYVFNIKLFHIGLMLADIQQLVKG